MTVSFVALFVGLLVLFFEDSQLTINIVNNKTRKYLFIIIIIFFWSPKYSFANSMSCNNI